MMSNVDYYVIIIENYDKNNNYDGIVSEYIPDGRFVNYPHICEDYSIYKLRLTADDELLPYHDGAYRDSFFMCILMNRTKITNIGKQIRIDRRDAIINNILE